MSPEARNRGREPKRRTLNDGLGEELSGAELRAYLEIDRSGVDGITVNSDGMDIPDLYTTNQVIKVRNKLGETAIVTEAKGNGQIRYTSRRALINARFNSTNDKANDE